MAITREFKICFEFWKEKNDNSPGTWAILNNRIGIVYYYNGNLDLCEILNY